MIVCLSVAVQTIVKVGSDFKSLHMRTPVFRIGSGLQIPTSVPRDLISAHDQYPDQLDQVPADDCGSQSGAGGLPGDIVLCDDRVPVSQLRLSSPD
jgi:hypothetical protein